MHAKIFVFLGLLFLFLLTLAFCDSPRDSAPQDSLDYIFIYQEDSLERFNAMRDDIMSRRRISGEKYLELTRDFTFEQFLAAFQKLADKELELDLTGWQDTELGWKLGIEAEKDGETLTGHLRFTLTASPDFAPELGESYTAVYVSEYVLGEVDLLDTLPDLYAKSFTLFLDTR
ncbi:MAG: hypothetical protein D6E12_06235 [Desulfovibrio sp.]|nr:MAG: hypothetical protein D6E12_06235 [Desulfovibrio sp.]